MLRYEAFKLHRQSEGTHRLKDALWKGPLSRQIAMEERRN